MKTLKSHVHTRRTMMIYMKRVGNFIENNKYIYKDSSFNVFFFVFYGKYLNKGARHQSSDVVFPIQKRLFCAV